mmetsp:Transcript_38628/g.28497  ORF Transcript_38628/g.28497 Transcript_38628/m.28497 type:complete len:112 (-) Transcript_38628:1038-1373(-)
MIANSKKRRTTTFSKQDDSFLNKTGPLEEENQKPEGDEKKTEMNVLEMPGKQQSFEPEYVSNNKKKKSSHKRKRKEEAFVDENNENLNSSNIIPGLEEKQEQKAFEEVKLP